MSVELVAVERQVWSGTATSVFAETTEGELGVLPGHTPLLGELVEGGIVKVTTTDGETVTAAVFGGFLSVTGARVTVLAEAAALADEIDAQAAQDALAQDRKSTRLNSSHANISYAVFCLKKKQTGRLAAEP